MTRIRVSIAGLLAGIGLVGITLAALINPSRLWGNFFYTLTIGTLLIAVLGAIYGRGPTRAFRVGFATCGLAYFLAIWGPSPISNVGDDLVTPGILDILYPLTLPKADPQPPTAGPAPGMPGVPSRVRTSQSGGGMTVLVGAFGGGGAVAPSQTAWEEWTEPVRNMLFGKPVSGSFRRIGHSIFCLLFALLGGILTRRFQQERERSRSAAPPVVLG